MTLTGTYRDAWRTSLGERGRLCHVRGEVDGHLVVRQWMDGRWHYFLLTEPRIHYAVGGLREPSRELKKWLETP